MREIGYSIKPHEHGWAVMIAGVIKGVYPSKFLAKKTAEGSLSQMVSSTPVEDRTMRQPSASTPLEPDTQPSVSVPHEVSVPVKDTADEVCLPADISGRNLSTGKL
ncbi:hypothetical protein [Agrobacterium sp.]|jgi:hypothetical protein|uniref:hypothetical protein n=1 Tax=Agrobacterium sp. TaxID=361 RepID=UPI0028A99D4C|nr:hypothetical protein [Agrobacterium sp.]